MKSSTAYLRSLLSIAFAGLIACGSVSAQQLDAKSDVTRKSRSVPVTSELPQQPKMVAQAAEGEGRLTKEERQEREKAALAFAKEHHPALERLLNYLRRMDPKEYQKAIRELARVSERLNNLKQRNPRTYNLQLEIWKANSSATLLAARIQLNPDQEQLRDELREALEKKRTLQRQLMQEELQRAKQRVERLEQNLERFERDSDMMLQRQMRQLAPPPASDTDAPPKQDSDAKEEDPAQ